MNFLAFLGFTRICGFWPDRQSDRQTYGQTDRLQTKPLTELLFATIKENKESKEKARTEKGIEEKGENKKRKKNK